jgi:murein L,D-transpeptidase YafK
VARVILRDSETVKDIRRTASTKLERGRPYRLVVIKSRYRLDVLEGNQLVKTFPVALGGSPTGPKREAHDRRTPEGEYTLLPHHASSGYGECFYICYPSERDAEEGFASGLIGPVDRNAIAAACRTKEAPPAGTHLGGLILLHGTKGRGAFWQTKVNWTIGCVGMDNRDLKELLSVYNKSDRPVLTIEP